MSAQTGAGQALAQWMPSHTGYQLVQYADGSAALVGWDPTHGWEWGTATPPPGEVIAVTNLGLHPFANAAAFGDAIKWLPTQVAEAFTRIASEGGITNPQGAIVVKSNGGLQNTHPIGSDTSQAPWTAKTLPGESGGNTDPLLPSLSGLEGDAVRVLEAVGAVLLLVVGLRALMGGPDVVGTLAKVAR